MPDNGHRGEMMLAWSGFVSISMFVFAWILLFGWLFPPPPSLSAEEIVSVYSSNLQSIRAGVILMGNFAGALTIAFAAIVTIYMLRMKGPSPALAWIQLACGAINVLIFILPVQIYATTAFRLDRAPEITQFGNDLGWLIFDMVVGPTQIQWIALGLAILWDQSRRPVFPRWFGYFNLYGAMLILLNNLILYFKTGPFAWNGILGWWPGALFFCLWYYVAFFVVRKAVQERRSQMT